MLLLSNKDVQDLLTMPAGMAAVEQAQRDIGQGEAPGLPRLDVYAPSGIPEVPYHRWGMMAGATRSQGYLAARLKSDMVSWPVVAGRQREEKWAREPGTFCGFIILYSSRTAEPVAILPDGVIQHVRVGAAAGVGTDLLARRDAETLGMLGSGGMAREYLEAFRLIRPIRRVRVFSPSVANRERYAREMAVRHGIEVTAVADPREAVRGADIVALCVSSIERVFETEWLEPGMHVTDVTTPSTARDFAQRVDVAAWNGHPTLAIDPPPEGAVYARGGTLSWVAGTPEELALIPRVPLNPVLLALPTVADVLAGKAPGRVSPEQTSFFHNQGRQGQLLAALSGVVYEAARDRGAGLEIPTDWFLEDVRD